MSDRRTHRPRPQHQCRATCLEWLEERQLLSADPLGIRNLLPIAPTREHAIAAAFSPPPTASLISTQSLTPIKVAAKNVNISPQSSVWTYAGKWWHVTSDRSGTWIWRLDRQTWTQVLKIGPGGGYLPDAKPDGDVTHILLMSNSRTAAPSKLVSVEYVAGDPGTYQAWS